MTTGDLKHQHRCEVLAGLSDQHPVWVTLMQILSEVEEAAAESLCQCDLKDNVRHYHAGYLAHVRDLQADLKQWRAEGMLAKSG